MTTPRRLEPFTPLRHSVLWDLQRRFYEQLGPAAWSSVIVPNHPTTNPLVARHYARVIAAFWRDCLASTGGGLGTIDPSRPLYVVELGTGSGRLGHGLHRALVELVPSLPVPVRPVVVCTDLVDANLDELSRHPFLAAALAGGDVALARLDVDGEPAPLRLRGGPVLEPDPEGNPIVVVANYILDTVRQDLFTVRDGRLHETRVAVEVPADVDPEEAHIAEGLELAYEDVPIELPYYDDPFLDGLLATYRDELSDGSVLVPAPALTALRHLRAIGGGRMLVVMGDKAVRHLGEWEGRERPYIAKHGSISVMANFHAVGELATRAGGAVWHERTARTGFTCSAAVVPLGAEGVDLRHTAQVVEEALEGLGPTTYHRLYAALRDLDKPSGEIIATLLRASEHDPLVVLRHGERLLDEAEGFEPRHADDLALALDATWRNYFPIGTDDDLPFLIGRLLYRMSRFERAIHYYQLSLEHHGEHHAVYYNLALCEEQRGRLAEAIAWLREAIRVKPDYETAIERLRRLGEAP